MARPFVKLSDSFKILRDKLNTVSYNVGDPEDLLTYGDSDVVMAINEIERVFDASAGEIIYPTGNALQGETQTRLLISTAQNSGTDIQINVGANFNVDAVGDINLDAGGANINFLDDSVNRFAYTLGATNTAAVTGNLVYDVSGDITLDAAGTQINFADGTSNRIVHNLGANQELDYTGNLTQDIEGTLTLDVDGGTIYLKDNGTQFGQLENSGNQLDIYSGSTLALQMTANTIEVHNRAFFLDSALDTVAQNVAGSVNEIHTQLDSAVSEIEVTKNTIESMLRVFDSGGTGVNISATGISTLNTLDKTFVGGINEIDTRLDSAVSEIEVVKTTVVGIIADVDALDTRVGPLSELDSATAGGFFDSAGTAGSIVKALNELARRTVLIYDESGTLLN
jgi:hypothetical protein